MDPKIVHNYRWLHEWARVAGLPLVFPTAHHPVKSVLAMRACCVLEQDQTVLQQFSKAAFDAYFARGENIDEPDVIGGIADDCGLDGALLVSGAAEQTIKDQLRSNTEEAIERGAYGSPTMLIGDALYFGNDQLPLVRAALLSEGS
jgi:2-hydroxychromene-2-carboxylate isomerase